MFPFRRILIADLSGSLDLDLLHYGSAIAGLQDETEIIVTAVPGERVLRSLVSSVESIFGAKGGAKIRCQVLPEVDLEGVWSTAVDAGADLLLTRHPRSDEAISRRLIDECPCSLWLVPEGANPRLRRVVAQAGLRGAAAHAVRVACMLGRKARAEELVAVHVGFHPTLDQDEEILERQQAQARTELSSMMARMETGEMDCSVKVESSPYAEHCLRRTADEVGADLLVAAARPARSWLSWQRPGLKEFAERSRAAMLVLRLPGQERRRFDTLRRIFGETEPAFN